MLNKSYFTGNNSVIKKQTLHKRDVGHFLNPSFNRIKKKLAKITFSVFLRKELIAQQRSLWLFRYSTSVPLLLFVRHIRSNIESTHPRSSCQTLSFVFDLFSRLPQSTKPCLLFSDDQSKSIYVVSFSVLDLTYFALCFGGNIRCMFAGISITNVWRGVNNRCTAVKGGHRFFPFVFLS